MEKLFIKDFIVAWTTPKESEPVFVCKPRIRTAQDRKLLNDWVNSLNKSKRRRQKK